ncbi:MAG: hypothetical protein ACYC5X_11665 [Syntrophales bacterium]
MNVIFFLSVTNEQGERLERVVELFFSRRSIEKCRNLESLGKKLHEPYNYKDVVLLSPASKEELSSLLSLQDLLSDMRVILVLPDRDDETVAMGHRLRPRMVSYSDGDYLDVAAVLTRMNEKRERQQ